MLTERRLTSRELTERKPAEIMPAEIMLVGEMPRELKPTARRMIKFLASYTRNLTLMRRRKGSQSRKKRKSISSHGLISCRKTNPRRRKRSDPRKKK